MFTAFFESRIGGEVEFAFEFAGMMAAGAAPLENGRDVFVEADGLVGGSGRRQERQEQNRNESRGTTTDYTDKGTHHVAAYEPILELGKHSERRHKILFSSARYCGRDSRIGRIGGDKRRALLFHRFGSVNDERHCAGFELVVSIFVLADASNCE